MELTALAILAVAAVTHCRGVRPILGDPCNPDIEGGSKQLLSAKAMFVCQQHEDENGTVSGVWAVLDCGGPCTEASYKRLSTVPKEMDSKESCDEHTGPIHVGLRCNSVELHERAVQINNTHFMTCEQVHSDKECGAWTMHQCPVGQSFDRRKASCSTEAALLRQYFAGGYGGYPGQMYGTGYGYGFDASPYDLVRASKWRH